MKRKPTKDNPKIDHANQQKDIHPVGWALAHQSPQWVMLADGINADLQKINTNISITP
ncbi:hypothetical protein JK628_08315 [Shewanella sp. KX20019]|uniref:hypothetical protein n=1 Tax=Shewanella sp. KX20019 TaxID=2803864 RepID=UPI0019275295|nr:hypothetical protein [Shewanella sp. KX20019]QQX81820.1 hypothetical protein JK628_08315 [Shewanella sp. KX20019]